MATNSFSFSTLERGSMKNFAIPCGVTMYFVNSSTGVHGFAVNYTSEVEPKFPSCNGINVYLGASSDGRWLCFDLTAEYLENVFITLCNDLAEYIRGDMNEISCLKKLRKRFDLWRNMLKISKKELDPAIEQGYFGEMLFLSKAINAFGEDSAVDSWAGPDKFSKDFSINGTWYEIKTIGSAAEKVTISSLNQLDDSKSWHLVIVSVERKTPESGDETIVSLINTILDSIQNPEVKDKFIQKLSKVGISLAIHPKCSFSLKYLRFYKVDNDFPRLTIQDKKYSEIVDIRYCLYIGALSRFMEDEKDALISK